jgi:hypothetical protein
MEDMTSDKAKRAFVLKILTDHDLVFGVWPDANKPDGIDFLLIKGRAKLRDVIVLKVGLSSTIAAIPCANDETALALQQTHGDKPHDA